MSGKPVPVPETASLSDWLSLQRLHDTSIAKRPRVHRRLSPTSRLELFCLELYLLLSGSSMSTGDNKPPIFKHLGHKDRSIITNQQKLQEDAKMSSEQT